MSDAFQKSGESQYEEGALECRARMLNINYGHNRELMQKCRRLEEYAIFVSKARKYMTEEPKNPSKAIERAVDECIEEGILVDILTSQKAEVLELALTTFDRELYEQGLREEGEAIGEARGEAQNILNNVANLQKNLNLSLEEALSAIGKTAEDYEKAKEVLK